MNIINAILKMGPNPDIVEYLTFERSHFLRLEKKDVKKAPLLAQISNLTKYGWLKLFTQ